MNIGKSVIIIAAVAIIAFLVFFWLNNSVLSWG